MTDYSALAQQFGGKPVAPPVDYSALAKKFGGKPIAADTPLAQSQTVGDLVTQIPGAVNDIVRGMARGASGDRINELAARVLPGDYETNLAAQNAMDEPSRRSGAAGASEFIGSALPAFLVAGGAGKLLEKASPTIARALPSVAPYLERATNAVKTAGFSLGEAAPTAPGVVAGVKNALINAGTRVGAGAGVNALAAQATAPNDVGAAALVGGALPAIGVVARPIFALAGKAMDRIKSFGGERPAAQIVRDTLAEHLQPALAALRAAPDDGRTAVQVLADAGIDAPAFAALGNLTEKASPSTAFKALTDAQARAQEQILTMLSGGANQAGAQTAINQTKAAVNAATTPLRESALGEANRGRQIPQLEAAAAQGEAAASGLVGDVRRLNTASELAAEQRRGIQAGETVNAAPASPNATPVDLGVRAERGANLAEVGNVAAQRAANWSLALGSAARDSRAAAQALRDAGVNPIDTTVLTNRLNNILRDPRLAAQGDIEVAVPHIVQKIDQWVNEGGGVIDANALDAIRKFGVTDALRKAMPNADAQALKAATVSVLSKINPLIDNAIEQAGGKGWRAYLATHSKGMHIVNQQRMAAAAQDLYRTNKPAFVDLVRGNDKAAVEDVFGSGKFDIAKEMGDQYPALKKVADQVARDLGIKVSAAEGTTAARNIVNERTRGITQWPRIGKGLRASGSAQDLFDAALSRNTQKTLYNALQSGQRAAAVLDKLSAAERAKLTGVFGGRTGLLRYLDDAFAGVSGGTTAGLSKTPEKREPLRLGITTQNAMSPPNQNAMAQ